MHNPTPSTPSPYDAVALFSGGLDSILAAKVVQAQGRRVKCLHFISPFFGKPEQLDRWRSLYDLDIEAIDVGEDYVRMMVHGPSHGYGKRLNPCVDCKILMLKRAKARMEALGAKCVVSGEVLGQRPMSQRRDALNIISRDADVRDILVRPLCALHLPPTAVEEAGVLDRSRLLGVSGRGRKDQLALAEQFALPEIPTPAGGCLLAEAESAKRYWPLLKHGGAPTAHDFHLANLGRQFWNEDRWLCVGRDQHDNQRLQTMASPGDLLFNTVDFPGPLCLGRQWPGKPWDEHAVREAAAMAASFSSKARKRGGVVDVSIEAVGEAGRAGDVPAGLPAKVAVDVDAPRPAGWTPPDWELAKRDLAALREAVTSPM